MRRYRTNASVLADLAPQMVVALKKAAGPVLARDIGKALCLAGGHEDTKRVVRDVVKYARTEYGERICANLVDGYWLARSGAEWQQYQEAERSKTIFRFVALKLMREAAAERTGGQGKLFDCGLRIGDWGSGAEERRKRLARNRR